MPVQDMLYMDENRTLELYIVPQKNFEKNRKKVLTKGEVHGIIVERSRETEKLKTEAKKLPKKSSKKGLTNRIRCDMIVEHSRERTGP